MGISVVGIIGAGTMGNGIAQACAVAGLSVVVVDVADAAVAKGIASGMPLGAMLARKKFMTWGAGSHGSTTGQGHCHRFGQLGPVAEKGKNHG